MKREGLLPDATGIRLTTDEVRCIGEHLEQIWDARRLTKKFTHARIREVMEHFTGELRPKKVKR